MAGSGRPLAPGVRLQEDGPVRLPHLSAPRVLVLTIATCLLSAPAAALQDPPNTITITGRVVADATDEPVRRAWVVVRGNAGAALRVGVTDLDGAFRFDGLPPGAYRVAASKRPYLAAATDTIGPAVVIRLPMGAAIYGVVTDLGKPARDVRVLLSGPALLPTAGITNVRGEYRIHGLPAGEYQVTSSRALEPRVVTLVAGASVQALPIELQEATVYSEQALAPVTGGSASVGGRVQDVRTGLPLSGIQVNLGRTGTTTLTDTSGRFRFEQLRPGSYALMLQHPDYAALASATVTLEATTHVNDVVLRAGRRGTIAGTVRDDVGDPVVGMPVRAFKKAVLNLQPTLMSASGPPVLTDERGSYRLDGLLPGEYLVCACAEKPVGVDPLLTMALGLAYSNLEKIETGLDDAVLTFPPTYFPGSTRGSDAHAVSVDYGDDRSGIDITVYAVKPFTVTGTVVENGAAPQQPTSVRLFPEGGLSGAIFITEAAPIATAPDGAFRFQGIAPGRYSVVANSANGSDTKIGITEISVEDRDLAGITIAIAERPAVQGRLDFSGRGSPPDAAALSKATVNLLPMQLFSMHQLFITAESGGIGTSATPDVNGRFVIPRVAPGSYNVSVRIPGSNWRTVERVATGDGAVSLDGLLDVGPAGVGSLVVTVSDTPLAMVEGQAVLDRYESPGGMRVIAFPAEKALWPDAARYPGRFVHVFLSANRTFRFESMPPGEYYFALVPGISFEMSLDNLETWSRTAQRLRLRGGETLKLELKK